MSGRMGRNRGVIGRMAAILIFAVALMLGGTVLAQSDESVPADEAGEHVGEEVTVCGFVEEATYIEEMEGEPTFLNFGAAWPDQVFSVVIFGEDRVKFRRRPDREFQNRHVCATGTIERVETGVRMVVTDPEAIEMPEDEG